MLDCWGHINNSNIIIIIIIKNEKIRVTLCENAAGALYIVNSNVIPYCSITGQICSHYFASDQLTGSRK